MEIDETRSLLEKEFDSAEGGSWFDRDDFSHLGVLPDGFVVKSHGDLGYIQHTACGNIIRVSLGFASPRFIFNKFIDHLKTCSPSATPVDTIVGA